VLLENRACWRRRPEKETCGANADATEIRLNAVDDRTSSTTFRDRSRNIVGDMGNYRDTGMRV
jgi:hypothetical protein